MEGAFGWGAVAASSLVIGAIVALLFRIGLRTIGLIMAFGAGVLISAVAFDLVEEAFEMASGSGWAIAGIFAGCAVFFGGDVLIDRLGGGERKDADGSQESGSSLAIVLGTVLDGAVSGSGSRRRSDSLSRSRSTSSTSSDLHSVWVMTADGRCTRIRRDDRRTMGRSIPRERR